MDVAALVPSLENQPRESNWKEVAACLRQLMGLAVQKSKEGRRVELQAFSGEADPRIWNACSEELLTAVGNGMQCEHLAGPVICTDGGSNAMVDAFRKFPDRVRIRMFATRYPYHWVRLTWYENSDICFDLKGEAYHAPLSDTRVTYEVELKNRKDAQKPSKLLTWYSREQNFRESKPVTELITSMDELNSKILSLEEFKAVLAKVEASHGRRGLVHPYDLLTRDQILEYAGKLLA